MRQNELVIELGNSHSSVCKLAAYISSNDFSHSRWKAMLLEGDSPSVRGKATEPQ